MFLEVRDALLDGALALALGRTAPGVPVDRPEVACVTGPSPTGCGVSPLAGTDRRCAATVGSDDAAVAGRARPGDVGGPPSA
ncbi:hypothetical protein BRC97_03690 [Halobacteriales archaeon QS_6_71_20]|nr:MAG: hypothetical protein BRC97_03690 [Halobacteriales archaeon QS_6_71_20]